MQKVPVFYQLYMMLFFSEGKSTICKPYPPKHTSHRLFHRIPCNRYSIQISWKNSWIFSILEIILENPPNSWKPPKFLKTPEFPEKWKCWLSSTSNSIVYTQSHYWHAYPGQIEVTYVCTDCAIFSSWGVLWREAVRDGKERDREKRWTVHII